uniref:BTB domain-containing protein n=1 Tax=Sinocyclocheilus grahami TaxID=75366 RepID=A0A672KII1_SINGR
MNHCKGTIDKVTQVRSSRFWRSPEQILSTEDGLSLHVHSLVMAAVSSVIQQKLQERDGGEKEISLILGPEVNGSGLAAAVELAYTGAISNLNKENMTQIQTAAVSLGAQRVMELVKVEEDGGNKQEKRTKISAEEQMKVNLQSMQDLWAKRVGCDVELVAEGAVFFGKAPNTAKHD